MADSDKNNEIEELTDEALTEIEGVEEIEEELTPIKERPSTPSATPAAQEPPAPAAIAQSGTGLKSGTFIASLRERFTAFFFDTLLLFYVYWVYAFVYGRIFLGSWEAKIPTQGWHGLTFHGSFLLIFFLYYFVLEGIFLATIGKFTCWMSVRKKDGEAASLLSTFVRNILRPIDYVLIIPVIFIMELTKFRQRLGDLFSGTTVVKKFGRVHETYSVTSESLATSTGRTVAMVIDLTLFGLFLGGYILMLSPKAPFLSHCLLILLPLVIITYFMLIEMITETSPGKWIMGYVTCHDNGRRLTISGSLIRTIWRVFDTNPVGLLCIFISSNRQRPGDLAAGTVVIKHKRKAKGLISFAIAIILAAITVYFGLANKTNVFSSKFKINFMPRLEVIKDLGLDKSSDDGDVVFQNFRFAANEPTDYRTPPTFSAGETVYLVFELKDYTKKDRKVWLQEDLSVTYPDGTIGLKQANIVDYRQVVKGDAPIEFTNNITLPDNAVSGEYQVNITIRDKFGTKELTDTQKFFVRQNFFMNPEQ